MNTFWTIILGALQGLTEFFPVSSSGHLTLIPWIFDFSDPGLAFDIALHAGTFFALLLAFWKEWFGLLKAIPNKKAVTERKMILFLILTSVPGAITGLLLEEKAETIFRTPWLIATTLIVFGIILLFVDKLIKKADGLEKMTANKAFLIGLSQAMAIIPGVSRSGATITAGRAIGFSRETAAKYSFMAALPIIFGATIFGLRDVSLSQIFSINWMLGLFTAFFASLFAMKFLLKYLKTHDFKIFFVWRFVLAATVIMLYLIRS